jgi:hypothetical protein
MGGDFTYLAPSTAFYSPILRPACFSALLFRVGKTREPTLRGAGGFGFYSPA